MTTATKPSRVAAQVTPAASKPGYFTHEDGRSYRITFFLVASLFLLWGLCNSMIDVMDKHFQDLLHLTKAQSAWVQFAHYVGYTIMALPAGLVTRRLGYRWGIISGLLLVSIGGFWFIPATQIAKFWAFLLGVCLIAMGLTVLETVANPYTTVLGPKQYGAFRINVAQTFNGVGWILGPLIGAQFFYASGGAEAASQTLYIPYLAVAIVVLVIAVIFYFVDVPDLKTEDEYHTDDASAALASATRARHTGRNFALMFLNAGVLAFAVYMLLALILPQVGVGPDTLNTLLPIVVLVPLALTGIKLYGVARKIPPSSIWAHPHFSGATLAQFLYVAAQAGIFSFFINYMVAEIPAISTALKDSWFLQGGAELRAAGHFINEKGAARLQGVVGFALFFLGRLTGSAILRKAAAHRVLGYYAAVNVVLCAIVAMKLGWISVAAVFLSFYFMSIMFPTIFALGIFGLGPESKKKAAAFIVMSITGGALMPKVMGHIGDVYDMSIGFLMPLGCFALIAVYGFLWPRLSQAKGLTGLSTGKGH